jgi:L-ascorbate metabolism protein UlaG (beta-lactamase superfamily)
MVITYYGISCFKIQSGDKVLVFDPPAKNAGIKTPRFESHLVLISHDHPKHNGEDAINPKEKEQLVINGPGEYEIKEIQITGISSCHDDQNGKKYGLNTIYKVGWEGINLCHLGDFGEKELSGHVKEELNGIDILFLPIGGETVINAQKAAEISAQIEPRIIIPMHYAAPDGKTKNQLAEFLKEMGEEKIIAEEKLTIKKKDISQEESKVVVLKPAI